MLRTFTRYLNETVFRGPDNEGGAGENDLDVGGSDIGGSGDVTGDADISEAEPLTVREQIKRSIEETSEPEKPKKAAKDKTGRFGDRNREAAPAGKDGAPVPEAPPVPAIAAPDSLPKEVKAEWDKTPPAIQQAFVKREQDMAKGVEELKSRYNLIDQAIAPHNDALRQMNATPADAVNRMFLWFKALAGSPAVAFPELAKNMGIDWNRMIAATTRPQGQPGQQGQPQPTVDSNGNPVAPEIPEPVKQYVGKLETQLGQLVQYVQQLGGQINPLQQEMNNQNQARINENLNIWSKDKPYFQEVRQAMGRLIETGVVPLKDGQVDLDTAYERAIYFIPEVRAKVLAEQQQANNQVQQDTNAAATTARQAQADKSRKAAVSLPARAPGNGQPIAAARKKPGEKLSVRDSLKASIEQLRDQ
jgi:hypothetical protein